MEIQKFFYCRQLIIHFPGGLIISSYHITLLFKETLSLITLRTLSILLVLISFDITEKLRVLFYHYITFMISFCVLNILYSAFNTFSEKDMNYVVLGAFELSCIFASLFILSKLVLWIDKILFKKVFIIHM